MKLPGLVEILGYIAGIVITAEGAIVTAYAAPVTVTGIGGIMGSTVFIAGIQLLILGLLTMGSWFLKDREVRWERINGIIRRFLPAAAFILGAVVAIEGAITAVQAGP
ncbi:MAG: hypothetical protein FJ151_04990 [Euryarchaeota archaeon]|nr:hypothetical protein [Euryarchaeota archaeon]